MNKMIVKWLLELVDKDTLNLIQVENKITVTGFRPGSAPIEKLILTMVNSKKITKIVTQLTQYFRCEDSQTSDDGFRQYDIEKLLNLVSSNGTNLAAILQDLITSNDEKNHEVAYTLFSELTKDGGLQKYVEEFVRTREQRDEEKQYKKTIASLQQNLEDEIKKNLELTEKLDKAQKRADALATVISSKKESNDNEMRKLKTCYDQEALNNRDLAVKLQRAEMDIKELNLKKQTDKKKSLEVETECQNLENTNRQLRIRLGELEHELEIMREQITQEQVYGEAAVCAINDMTRYALIAGTSMQKQVACYSNVTFVKENELVGINLEEFDEILLPLFASSSTASIKIAKLTDKKVVKFTDVYKLRAYIERRVLA